MTEAINQLAPDVLVWTGDIIPHDVWNMSLEESERYGNFLSEYMKEHFSQW